MAHFVSETYINNRILKKTVEKKENDIKSHNDLGYRGRV